MFKIESLNLVQDTREYKYKFQEGINHFQGTNDTGKTEYFKFIDYMFGSSDKSLGKDWFRSVSSAKITFRYKSNTYIIKRNLGKQDDNDFICVGRLKALNINQDEYRNKLNAVFSKGANNIENLELFAGEKLTYRTFTLFNFLNEKSQGKLHDFFSKSDELKYSIKLPGLLDYIFNPNLREIQEVRLEISILKKELKSLEIEKEKEEFLQEQINYQLGVLNIPTTYSGRERSKKKILGLIKDFEGGKFLKQSSKNNTIADLQSMLTNLNQQIKVYSNRINDLKKFKKDDENKKKLYMTFKDIVESNPQVEYLVDPILGMISSIDKNIAFTNHYIINNTLDKLVLQKKQLESEINKRNAELDIFPTNDVEDALVLVKNYLKMSSTEVQDIETIKRKLKSKKDHLKLLQKADDKEKILNLSKMITELYLSAAIESDFVGGDKKEDIYIKYFKKGNIIQPTINDNNIYVGSKARHTLMQVCGYIAFLEMLIKEDKYPLIPILCLDHVSQPFDSYNLKAFGAVLKEVYSLLSKNEFQIFIFDEKSPDDFGFIADHYENLVTEAKSGFIPFYNKHHLDDLNND